MLSMLWQPLSRGRRGVVRLWTDRDLWNDVPLSSSDDDVTRLPRGAKCGAVRRRPAAGLVGDAVAGGQFRADQRLAGQFRQIFVAVERVDDPAGELRGLGVLGESG